MCDTQRLSQTTFGTSASEDLLGAPQFDCPPKKTPGLDPPLYCSAFCLPAMLRKVLLIIFRDK